MFYIALISSHHYSNDGNNERFIIVVESLLQLKECYIIS